VGEGTSDARLFLDFCASAPAGGVWAKDRLVINAAAEKATRNAKIKLSFPNP
jgi:hypothetical protein